FTDSLRCELLHERSNIHLTMVQMPAVNTPQFDWARNRMGRQAQPVPPVFQPEVIARAVWFAARHRRREIWVGWPTVKAIWGQKLIPGLLDRYLARTAWSGQQTNQAEDPGRPDNLFEPVAGDPGTRGTFGNRSSAHSTALWVEENRGWVFVGAAVAVGTLAALGWYGARSQSGSARPMRDRIASVSRQL
ncbi:MAG: hypothetical protein ACREPS_11060, partial [Rhodanobacteraceae bacterium]